MSLVQIRAAIARANQPFTLEVCEQAVPVEHEVRVAVEACGICHTDLSVRDHGMGTPLPAVLGHEGVGRVIELGPGVTDFAIGDRVVMSFGACGTCPSCRAHTPAYCRNALALNLLGTRLDGSSPLSLAGTPITGHYFAQSSFATHAIARTTNLVKLDADLPATAIAPMACSVQTGAGTIVNVLAVGADDSVAIYGCGSVGLGAVMAARIAGAKRIIAVDVDTNRLELARELGATHAIDRDAPAAIAKLGGLSRALDTTGVPAVIEGALAVLRPRGVLALAAVSPRGTTFAANASELVMTGRIVRGTVEGDANPRTFVPQLIAWYRDGRLPIDKLVTPFPFERINDATADMLAHRIVKPVLVM